MRTTTRRAAWLGALLLLLAATPARAEAILSPNIGGTFGGDVQDGKLTYGGTLTLKGASGIVGFAADFAYTPDFFGDTNFESNNVTTLMGNLVLMTPGELRFYGSGGIGLLKTHVETAGGFFDVDSNDFGFDVGAGLLVFPGQGRFGILADVRYFRNLSDNSNNNSPNIDLGSLDFWRATGGIALKF